MAQVLKDEVRNRILAEAKKEFYQCGYQDSSLRRIASEADLAVGNVYRYFTNKENLYEEVIKSAYTSLNQIIDERTNHLFKLIEKPNKKHLTALGASEVENVITRVIGDVEELFKVYRTELIILLKASRCLEDDSRYKILRWFEMLFDIIYQDSDMAEHFAWGFLESIIHIAEKENEDFKIKIDKLVRFYFLR